MPQEGNSLYSRGRYRLEWDRRSDGSLRTPFLQIVWYDQASRRNRSRSTGTDDMHAAEEALDRLYLERERGVSVCPTCNRPFDHAEGFPVTQAIADYVTARQERASIQSIRPRLAHWLDFMDETGRTAMTCEQVDGSVIEAFRSWSAARPVIEAGVARPRAPGTTEATVRILAAAINLAHTRRDTPYPAGFTALPAISVSRTPTYRSSVEELAAMFRYCLHPEPPKGEAWSEVMAERQRKHRASLMRFLQVSVATWCRPDAAYDLSVAPERDQWISTARVVQLNPRGRRQTKKYRPAVPVGAKFARLLDQADGFYVGVQSVRKAFEAMLDHLGLPRQRETGVKLIRRSIAHLARRRIGEERWIQGEMMLGHRKAKTSDLYALPDPANLGVALAVTDEIIDEIDALCPGAFTGPTPELKLVKGAKNG